MASHPKGNRKKAPPKNRSRNEPIKVPKQRGKPRSTIYSTELGAYICEALGRGKSVETICADPRMPSPRTVYYWIEKNEEFQKLYLAAKEQCAEFCAEAILEIADDATNDFMEQKDDDGHAWWKFQSENVARSRLRVEARKWIAAKLKPRKYGDKLALTDPEGDGPAKFIVEFVRYGDPKLAEPYVTPAAPGV